MRQLRKLAQLKACRLQARDGEIGRLKEVFFDDRSWTVRYLVVRTGNWLLGREVLVVPSMFEGIDDEHRSLNLGLTRDQVENSPPVETSLPISRHYEQDYYGHYGLHPYWMDDPLLGGFSEIDPAPPEQQPREPDQPHLRSSDAVTDYHLQARDGAIGHVEDFILDDEDWTIRYLEVNTRNWLPGKHVLVAPIWIHSIDWRDEEVVVNLEREAIEAAPAYDPAAVIGRDYEVALYKHYGKTLERE